MAQLNNYKNGVRIEYSSIKVLTGTDLSKRRIPYMSIKSEQNGPVVWLTGCMHGDEIGGTVIIHEIFKWLKNNFLRGSIHAFPLLNPFGFESIQRQVAFSSEDLNRSFPGNSNGTFAQRIAKQIFTFICDTNPTLVLDLHNDWNKSIPYVIIDDINKNKETNDAINHFAQLTGFIRIKETDMLESSLSYNLVRNDIPSLTIEMGESMIINEENIKMGMHSILNILSSLEMIRPEKDLYQYPLPNTIKDRVLIYSSKPLCSSSGIIRFLKKPGDIVQKGQKIALIYNAFGKLIETLKATNHSIVLGHTDYSLAFPGFPVMAFGIIDKDYSVPAV